MMVGTGMVTDSEMVIGIRTRIRVPGGFMVPVSNTTSYKKGLTGEAAAWVVHKQKSHWSVSEAAMKALEARSSSGSQIDESNIKLLFFTETVHCMDGGSKLKILGRKFGGTQKVAQKM